MSEPIMWHGWCWGCEARELARESWELGTGARLHAAVIVLPDPVMEKNDRPRVEHAPARGPL